MATKPISTGTRLTIAEFLDLPDTELREKMELDDGELYIMPRPRPVHQFLVFWLGWYFANYINSFADPPAEVYPDMVVILSREPRRVLAPDFAIILTGNPYQIVGGYFEGIPDIMVEVLSTDRRRDLVRKRQLYAEAGVLEYWIVDPRDDTVTLLELRDEEYTERAMLTVSDTLTTPLLPGLAIPLNDVFRHRQRPADD
ncbi:MAG: Uma2 family endonuclease [Chloroflexi bacterium]|nr:Uma2 family endonuclease [Chloroflexota bacterium]